MSAAACAKEHSDLRVSVIECHIHTVNDKTKTFVYQRLGFGTYPVGFMLLRQGQVLRVLPKWTVYMELFIILESI